MELYSLGKSNLFHHLLKVFLQCLELVILCEQLQKSNLFHRLLEVFLQYLEEDQFLMHQKLFVKSNLIHHLIKLFQLLLESAVRGELDQR
ncbi:MAG: hypothetical protein CL464_11225 [Acidimicrobiaceae bacterium]|nr:hypothetical protein [Acidimicrobiaceae bacterium]